MPAIPSEMTAMVVATARMWNMRLAAGWDFDPDYGWGSPDGITEHDWEHILGYPFPEDPDYAQFIAERGMR